MTAGTTPATTPATATGIRAVVFDAYGTLFDIAAPTARLASRIGPAAERLGDLWRSRQLEYTWLLTLMGRYRPFDVVTADALAVAMAACGVDDPVLAADLLAVYERLDAFADARTGLAALADRGWPRAILSNGTPGMLSAAVGAAGLAPLIDDILSADQVGLYKPHPAVYRLAVDRLGVPAADIAFVSSNGWDIAGATAFGFRPIWLNRTGRPAERLGLPVPPPITTLDGLADHLGGG